MIIQIDFSTGNVTIDAYTVASRMFDIAHAQAGIASLTPRIVHNSKSTFFRIDKNCAWEDLATESFVVEVGSNTCLGCVINFLPIESHQTSEQCLELAVSRLKGGVLAENNTPSYVTYCFNWGSVTCSYDPHYGAASLELKYKS